MVAAAGCARDGAVDTASTAAGSAGRGAAADISPTTAGSVGGRHIVLPGETLSELAERYGVTLSELARANRIERPYGVHVGQVFTIPGPGAGAGKGPTTYKIRPGDTLAAIAARNGLRLGDVVAANPGLDPDRVRVGQQVRIPGDVAMPPAPPMTAEEVELVRKASQTKPPSLSGEGFAWPLRGGKILSRFGEKPDGTRNDGVNIAASAGSPVLAAGERHRRLRRRQALGLRARRSCVRHAGGFTTAYAHNQKLLVRLGDPVRRGQRIATVGATGGVRQPQLHFELRAGQQPD
jgi:murein DD-endopeptidase MepM/ murein hydrolase activator NlpD